MNTSPSFPSCLNRVSALDCRLPGLDAITCSSAERCPQGPVPVVAFEAVEKHFGSTKALRGIDLSIDPGCILAVLGPNGAGKSTLFGCLLGLTKPTGGRILYGGHPVQPSDRRRFGYVAERIALYPQRSVRENGLFFAQMRGQSADKLTRQIGRVGLAAVIDRPVRHLSKGMLQRLGLAIALCGRPELLVLDEPFNGLDPALLENLQRLLLEEKERGATILVSTHTMSAVEQIATHVAIMLDGRLVSAGTMDSLCSAHPGASLETIYHRIARQHRNGCAWEVSGS